MRMRLVYGTGLPDLLATSGDATNGYYLDYLLLHGAVRLYPGLRH